MLIVQHLDDVDLTEFTKIAAEFGQERFGYVVTPNVDHLIRYHDDPRFRATYADAAYVLLDSRFLAYLLTLTAAIRPKVCTGSDLTARLFGEVIHPDDRVVLVGGTAQQARQLRSRYGLRDLEQYSPPMGFIANADAVEECLEYVESRSPFRFCLLAVGSPQQELVAQMLKVRGRARGLALCVGAAVNFITGTERRAPRWMQGAGLEWLYRLSRDPGRLARRYLVRGPRVFWLLGRTKIVLRRAA
ncbi:MAG: WecB/TagA/CpsF family glycosyltransferase [Gammaproteobacteria bacterium]|nr:WecB/TagA/CpsF family glycosyltransferase [Gammaproteobacteria bacterium]